MTQSRGEACPFEEIAGAVRLRHPHGGLAVLSARGPGLELSCDDGRVQRFGLLAGVAPVLRAIDAWLDARRWTSEALRVPPAPRLGPDAVRAVEALRDAALRLRWPLAPEVEAAVAGLRVARPRLLASSAFHSAPHFTSDVIRYRAAAIALAFLEPVLLRPRWRVPLPEGGAARPRAPDVAQLLARMSEWRGLYSPTGEPYRSLNRTLMNLPEAVPPRLVCELRHVHLERPVTTPLALSALAWRAFEAHEDAESAVERSHLLAFQRATDREVAHAVGWVSTALRRRLDPAAQEDLRVAARFLADFPLQHDGTLGGLARAAVDWHMACSTGGRRLTERELAAPTARPPIPLLEHEAVRFLDTVRAVIDEGRRMQHCVGSYHLRAASGACFLFHVTAAGCEATVCVSADGEVREASGPRNERNAAVLLGHELLAPWGALFPHRHTRLIPSRRRRGARDAPALPARPERAAAGEASTGRDADGTAAARRGWQQLRLWP